MAHSAVPRAPLTAQSLDQLEPWGRHGPWEDRRRRDILLASLPRMRYSSVFHPGCGTGVLTHMLAARCDEVLASDCSPDALGRCADRLLATTNVMVEHRRLPQQWPLGRRFDLVVLVDVAWHLTPTQVVALADRTAAALTPDGVVAACHWRHPPLASELSGEQVHRILRHHDDLVGLASHTEQRFVLDILSRLPDLMPPTTGA